jgi:hypothetical protein
MNSNTPQEIINLYSKLNYLNRLKIYYKQLSLLNFRILNIFKDLTIWYHCNGCGFSGPLRKNNCYICGGKNILKYKRVRLDTPLEDLPNMGFTPEALIIIRNLANNHRQIIQTLNELSQLIGKLDIKFPEDLSPKIETLISLSIIFEKSEEEFGKITRNAIHHLQELNALFQSTLNEIHNIAQIGKNAEIEIKYRTLFRILLQENSSVIKDLEESQTLLEEVKTSPIIKEIYQITKKRTTIHINPQEISPEFSGKITLIIRYNVGRNSKEGKIQLHSMFLEGISTFGSIENFNLKVSEFITQLVKEVVLSTKDTFQSIFGKNMRFTFYVDIQKIENAGGFAGEVKKFIFGERKLVFNEYDPTFKTIEVNISPQNLFSALLHPSDQNFKNTFIHELNHVLDKKVKSKEPGSRIRAEGIAMFSTFAYNKHIDNLKVELLQELMHKPLKTKEDYLALNSKSEEDPDNISQAPYILGEFITLIIFLRFLKQRNPKIQINIFNKEELQALINNPIYQDEAKKLLKILRNTNPSKYFELYFQFTSELNIPPIITPEFLEDLKDKPIRGYE